MFWKIIVGLVAVAAVIFTWALCKSASISDEEAEEEYELLEQIHKPVSQDRQDRD
jgi:nitrogen fixation-related uncharacterized protein